MKIALKTAVLALLALPGVAAQEQEYPLPGKNLPEEALAKSQSAGATQARNMVADARRLASQVPINDKRASDKEVSGAFKSKSGHKAQLETEWENIARANYAKARELADKAAGMAR